MITEQKLKGVERVYASLLARTYELINEYDLAPMGIDECTQMQDIISNMTLGQLTAFTQLGDRLRDIKLHSIDPQCGTLYLTITGLYGGMDTDGFIHT